jgi:hypothetical protein
MFLAHSFRLRDPWQCVPVDGGGLRWRRVFHRPTGLEEDDQLVLVISGLPEGAHLTVNGHALAGGPDYNLTAVLAETNQIDLSIPPTACSPQPTASPPPFPYDARLGIVAAS